jgi:hypothetical protein
MAIVICGLSCPAIANPLADEMNRQFDLDKNSRIDGKDWVRMKAADRPQCAGAFVALIAGAGGLDIDLSDENTQQNILALGKAFSGRLDKFYRNPKNRSVSVPDAVADLIREFNE